MTPQAWELCEVIVILFFASRTVSHEACVDLLNYKCNSFRELPAVQSKLQAICQKHRGFYNTESKTWNMEAVDEWISSQNVDNLKDLIWF